MLVIGLLDGERPPENKTTSTKEHILLLKTFTSITVAYTAIFGLVSRMEPAPANFSEIQVQAVSAVPPTPDRVDKSAGLSAPTVFRHGQVDWLGDLALQAGWLPEHLPTLREIILRESGGCPNVRGGDVVNEKCEVVRVREWNHRSDTGLLQINGVNYDLNRSKWARICLDLEICTQEPLLDALTNLRAGKLLYDYAGWDPWNPCTYGEKWAHLCKRTKKVTP